MLLYFIRGLFVIMIAAALFVSISYDQSIQDRQPDAGILYDMGVQMEQEGNMEGALENYRKALDIRSDPEMDGDLDDDVLQDAAGDVAAHIKSGIGGVVGKVDPAPVTWHPRSR